MERSKVLNYIVAMLSALLTSVVLVFLFAIILSVSGIPSSAIKPINQVIKGIALAVGVVIALKGDKGAVKGAVFGAVYSVLSFLLFSVISGSFTLDIHALLDIVFCTVLGSVIGIIKVNSVKN